MEEGGKERKEKENFYFIQVTYSLNADFYIIKSHDWNLENILSNWSFGIS